MTWQNEGKNLCITITLGSLVSWGELFVIFFVCFTSILGRVTPFRSDLGEPAPFLSPNPKSLMHTGRTRCPGMEKSRAHAAASHLWLNSTSTTLGSARVERSPRSFSLRAICRRTRRMILPAGRMESFSFRRKRRNWECKKTKAPSTWTCFGKPWSILDEIRGGYWSDFLPYWMTKQNKVSKCEIDWDWIFY